MAFSYEEVRDTIVRILKGERVSYSPNQYRSLIEGVREILERETGKRIDQADEMAILELFWEFFRRGVISIGLDSNNPDFPFFHVTELGRRLLEGESYFVVDISEYDAILRRELPSIDSTTLIYLKESMQAFRSDCLLSSSVMLGVATEHMFLRLLEVVESNAKYALKFQNVFSQKTILQKLNKFRNILESIQRDLPTSIKEDLDTNFSGIVSIIRNFRNESGHPTGKFISREQQFVLLRLFVPYCKKIIQLMEFFSTTTQ